MSRLARWVFACRECGGRVDIGDPITKGTDGWMHAECPENPEPIECPMCGNPARYEDRPCPDCRDSYRCCPDQATAARRLCGCGAK